VNKANHRSAIKQEVTRLPPPSAEQCVLSARRNCPPRERSGCRRSVGRLLWEWDECQTQI